MGLNPQLLRQGKYDLARRNPSAKSTDEGEQLLLAILAATENLVDSRKSFRESAADYNPLGQFAAAHGGAFTARRPDDF